MKPNKTGTEEEEEYPRKGLLGRSPARAEEACTASKNGGDNSVTTQDRQKLCRGVNEANVGASGKKNGAFQGAYQAAEAESPKNDNSQSPGHFRILLQSWSRSLSPSPPT